MGRREGVNGRPRGGQERGCQKDTASAHLRLDVAVHDPKAVQMGEPSSEMRREAQACGKWRELGRDAHASTVQVQRAVKRPPRHILHEDCRAAVKSAHAQALAEVLALRQFAHELGLGAETFQLLSPVDVAVVACTCTNADHTRGISIRRWGGMASKFGELTGFV